MPSIWLGNETKNGNKQQKSFILQTANFWWAIRNYLLWATLNFYSVHLRYKLNFAQRIKSKCFINNSSNAKNMMHSCKFLSSSVELFRLRCVWFFQNIFKIIHSLFAKWIKSLMLTNWFVFLRKWFWPTCLPVSWGPGPVSAGSRTALLAGTPPCAPPPTAPATPPPPPRCAPPHSSHPAWTEHTTYQFYITIARALINKKSRFFAFPTERLSHPSASKTVVHMYTQNVFYFFLDWPRRFCESPCVHGSPSLTCRWRRSGRWGRVAGTPVGARGAGAGTSISLQPGPPPSLLTGSSSGGRTVTPRLTKDTKDAEYWTKLLWHSKEQLSDQ